MKTQRLHIIRKYIFRTVIVFFGITLLVFGAIQVPLIQTKLVALFAANLSHQIEHNVSIEKVNLTLLGNIRLSNIAIKDEADSSLLSVEQLELNFALNKLISSDSIIIEEAKLFSPKFHIRKREIGTNLSHLGKAISALFPKDTTRTSTKSSKTVIKAITLSKGTFSIFNKPSSTINREQFEGTFFSLYNINGTIEKFYIHKDTIEAQISELSAKDHFSPLNVSTLSTFFRMTSKSLSFDKLIASVGESYINEEDVLSLHFKSFNGFNHFVRKVKMNAHLKNTVINTNDLGVFVPSLQKYHDIWRIDGNISGSVNRLKGKNLTVRFGENSTIKGEFITDGLPNILETFIELDVKKSHLLVKDLKQYINSSTYNDISKFNFIKFTSKFVGFPSDFVAYGDFLTGLGALKTDVKFNPSISGITQYEGKVNATDFKLGTFLNRNDIGKTSFQGAIKGEGFKVETAHLETSGNFDYLELSNYKYRNITTKLELEGGFGSGDIKIKDPNIKGLVSGTIDVRKEINILKLSTDLNYANLKQLLFLKDSTYIKGKLHIDLKGVGLISKQNINKFTGNIKIDEGSFYLKNHLLDLTNTEVIAEEQNSKARKVSINSNYINAVIEGDFQSSSLFNDMRILYKEYLLSIENNTEKINTYYAEKENNTKSVYPHDLHYSVQFKDLNPILEVVVPRLHISKGATFSGSYENGTQTKISLEGAIHKIVVNKKIFNKNSLSFSASKSPLQTKVLSHFTISSTSQIIDKNLSTEKMSIQGIWENNKINFSAFTKKINSNNHLDLVGNISLLEDSILFHLDKTSELQVFDDHWRLKPRNSILLNKGNIICENVIAYSNDQFVQIDGEISPSSDKKLTLNVKNFKLNNLEMFTGKNIDGDIYAKIELADLYKDIKINSRVIAKNLAYLGTSMGSFSGNVGWDDQNKKFKVKLFHFYNGSQLIKIQGEIRDIFKIDNELDLKLTVNNLDISLIEPFIQTNINDIQGQLDGALSINGKLKAPYLSGALSLNKAKCHVAYLNTDYEFHNANVYFNGQKASFKNIVVQDHLRNKGLLTGSIAFDKSIYSDVFFNFKKFNLLNKQVAPEKSATFYGAFYGSGDLHIFGKSDDITIASKELRTDNRTKIYIPLDGHETVKSKDYIRFISSKDSITTDLIANKIDLSGIKLDLNLSVNDQTYVEIIFDKKAGDIMKGYGAGDMKIYVDTRGDFNLYGNYVINKGSYNFTLGNVINKEFTVEPNSSITWTGDPYKGKMDIYANYEQNTTLTPILDTALVDFSRVETKRKYPVSVQMHLTEELLAPELNFDINITDYPNSFPGKNNTAVNTDEFVNEFYGTIKSNEQELNKQVFSLIILKRLAALNSSTSNNSGGGSAGNTVSEFLGNYLSHVLSQVNENLDIDLDLSELNNDTQENITVRFSYSFFEGRFRVSRSGNFSNNKNTTSSGTNGNNVNNLVGDWTVEYAISQDGKLRVKAFNKSDPDLSNLSQSNAVNVTYGASLLHTQNFNKLGDIIRRKKKKK